MRRRCFPSATDRHSPWGFIRPRLLTRHPRSAPVVGCVPVTSHATLCLMRGKLMCSGSLLEALTQSPPIHWFSPRAF
ncbi:unnamed protein product [Arctogadus glacialis]